MKLQYHPNVFFTALLQLFPPPIAISPDLAGSDARPSHGALRTALQPMPASRIFADGWKGGGVLVFETLAHHKIGQFQPVRPAFLDL